MNEVSTPFSASYATLEALRTLAEAWNAGPPMKHFGARLEFTRVDRVRAVIDPVQPFHRGGLGTEAVNGVVLAGLFDLVIGTVGWLSRPEGPTATVNLAMTFFRPTMGNRVVAEAWLIRAGMSLIFAAAEIRGESGEASARCDGTCAVAPAKMDNRELYERMRAGRIAP